MFRFTSLYEKQDCESVPDSSTADDGADSPFVSERVRKELDEQVNRLEQLLERVESDQFEEDLDTEVKLTLVQQEIEANEPGEPSQTNLPLCNVVTSEGSFESLEQLRALTAHANAADPQAQPDEQEQADVLQICELDLQQGSERKSPSEQIEQIEEQTEPTTAAESTKSVDSTGIAKDYASCETTQPHDIENDSGIEPDSLEVLPLDDTDDDSAPLAGDPGFDVDWGDEFDEEETFPLQVVPDKLPSDELPTNELPADGLPTNELPTNELPANELPANELPANELPTNELPTDELPTDELPTNELPTDELPTNELPTNELPTNELPTNELPTNELPTNELPAGELPADELPADELPADELPADELPADEHAVDAGEAIEQTEDGIELPPDYYPLIPLAYLGKRHLPQAAPYSLAAAVSTDDQQTRDEVIEEAAPADTADEPEHLPPVFQLQPPQLTELDELVSRVGTEAGDAEPEATDLPPLVVIEQGEPASYRGADSQPTEVDENDPEIVETNFPPVVSIEQAELPPDDSSDPQHTVVDAGDDELVVDESPSVVPLVQHRPAAEGADSSPTELQLGGPELASDLTADGDSEHLELPAVKEPATEGDVESQIRESRIRNDLDPSQEQVAAEAAPGTVERPVEDEPECTPEIAPAGLPTLKAELVDEELDGDHAADDSEEWDVGELSESGSAFAYNKSAAGYGSGSEPELETSGVGSIRSARMPADSGDSWTLNALLACGLLLVLAAILYVVGDLLLFWA